LKSIASFGDVRPFHRRECLNSANPECLPQGRAPKDRGLASPHPGWVIAQGLPKLLWLRPGLAPSEQVVAPATAAKTPILVEFPRDHLDLSETQAITLAG